MLIKQVFIENADQAQDVRVVDGKFVAIANHLEAVADEQVIDAAICGPPCPLGLNHDSR